MGPILRAGYEAAARAARAVAAVAPASRNKVVASFAARRGAVARYEAFGRTGRTVGQPLLWMHAPSVGEGLQARPVLELAASRRPDVQRAYSWFSPSARPFAASLDVHFSDALPFDTSGDMRRIVRALSPTALVFAKLDVWPTLAREASRAGVRLGIVSATLSATSSRRTGVAATLLREAYARLDRVGAISMADADRLIALGVPSARISVTGDTRYDQVWARAAAVDRESHLLEPLSSDRFTLVTGSSWPADEAALLPAWTRLSARHGEVRLIIAPHEPTSAALAAIEAWATGASLSHARLGSPRAADADVVIVDRVGVLGDLYALGSVAYVGGGFHAAGLHSVLEPASFGLPVLFGPRHGGSRDAGLLLDADGAVAASDADSLYAALERWHDAPAERQAAGSAARHVVRQGLGAAERSFALVSDLLG